MKRSLGFLGYPLTRTEHSFLVSLIEMTAGRIGLHKRDFRSESVFWHVIGSVTECEKLDTETFYEAVRRISGIVRKNGLAWRDVRIISIEPQASALVSMAKDAPAKTGERKLRAHRFKAVKAAPLGSKGPLKGDKNEFYKSWEWRTLRMEVLKEHGRACQCCGAEPGMKASGGEPVRICVDHIKPLSKFWGLRLDRSNLQVLCDECNQGKGNWDQTDFRPAPVPDEWVFEDEAVSILLLDQLKDRSSGALQ